MMGPPKQPHRELNVGRAVGDFDALFPDGTSVMTLVLTPPPEELPPTAASEPASDNGKPEGQASLPFGQIFPPPYAGREYPGCYDGENRDTADRQVG